jgi:dipeptidyl-peptidase-4
MITTPTTRRRALRPWASIALLLALPALAIAQDRLKRMPGYEQHEKMSRAMAGSFKSGAMSVTWTEGGKSFEFRKDGKLYRYDIASKKTEEPRPETRKAATEPQATVARRPARARVVGLERGRQAGSALSPDGLLKAFHRDRNLWLSDARGVVETRITTDGDDKTRVKNATGSWVYGEELDQITALWWSPDSKKVAFYRFDESKVPDFYLEIDQTHLLSKIDTEPYPKAGAPNPVVDLLVVDVESKKFTTIAVRDGKPFTDDVVGHYVYDVGWTPDGKEILLHRTNRRQNVLELAAADPTTGKVRVVIHEEWPESWVENSPPMQFLKDGKRFLWTSERNGWKNLYLYELSGKLLATLTHHEFEVARVVRVDEEAGVVDYLARDGDNPHKMQLHRVTLDGSNDRRFTDPALHHGVDIAPDGKHFIDVAQTHDIPPSTRLVSAEGVVIDELNRSDLTTFEKLGLHKIELLTFKGGDGKTVLYGSLHKPSNFDPKKTYPLLVSVYGGPLPDRMAGGTREVFATPSPLAEYGFLVASFDARSGSGRGKRFLDAIYKKLGQPEIDDQAAGVKALRDRPYVDKTRVGIFGTSYGGYASILCLLRHPDVFQAAVACSAVTDWKNYDSIYTERYMWTPDGNPEGYKAGSAMTYADKLQGRLMIFYGTADNNVHPNNSLQLIQALQSAGKSFDVQVGPDMGHSAVRTDREMEFFIEHLVVEKP